MVRLFESGATRDDEDGKWDFEGFLSPEVLDMFAEYMHKHRVRSDGSLRDSDDWQKGMPLDVYMKSMFRHFMDVWRFHRGTGTEQAVIYDSLMALMFNVQGYAFELIQAVKEGGGMNEFDPGREGGDKDKEDDDSIIGD